MVTARGDLAVRHRHAYDVTENRNEIMGNGFRQLVILRDGGIGEGLLILGDVHELADLLNYQEFGDYSITEVYALSPLNELKRVRWTTAQGEYDDNDWASMTVTVVFPDGGREQASYRVDGRA